MSMTEAKITFEMRTRTVELSLLPPIQCHKMIVKAVRNGVRPERI